MDQLIGAASASLIKDSDTARFVPDVIEASQKAVVLVDFWATWCGPCKTLGPLLEKVVKEMRGAVLLVKIDVDKNPELSAQLRVQSVPTVYAFKNGRPVDAFSGALPESQIRSFIKKLTAGSGTASLSDMITQAQGLLDTGHPEEAAALFQDILSEDPSQVLAVAGLLRCLLALGEDEQAQQFLARIPADMADHDAIRAVRTALDLRHAAPADNAEVAALRQSVMSDPDNHAARFDLAVALYAAAQEDAAVEELLELFRRDRTWNDGAAKAQLLKIFEALGFNHPAAVKGRRQLSSLMFA